MTLQTNKISQFKRDIVEEAKRLGFDLASFTSAQLDKKYLEVFDNWLENGLEADMAYMQKVEARRDIKKLLPGAKTVIVLAANYYRDQPELGPDEGRVARYAYGRDYHKIIGKKLKKLEKFIEEGAVLNGFLEGKGPHGQSKDPSGRSRSKRITKSYVDTGPILERAYAEQAGIGVIGKNGCVISREFGSYIFLSEIITTLDFPLDQASKTFNNKTVCGNCTKCIDACPTGAIIAPGIIDSHLCISYLTIENRKDIPPELAEKIREVKRIYGCDICQEVCPHNQARQKITTHWEFSEKEIAGDSLSPKKEEASLRSDESYLEKYAGSPFMRIKRTGLKRNLKLLGPN